ncbi:hypothetical protein MYX06_02140 [Patescibacteria group bacterium AH-259-L05]|nr:hypothetical protein [Patescibacteria group bacterium AH-259-L05]
MDKEKRERPEKKGWRKGTVAEFLGLSPKEEAEIERRLEQERARDDNDR